MMLGTSPSVSVGIPVRAASPATTNATASSASASPATRVSPLHHALSSSPSGDGAALNTQLNGSLSGSGPRKSFSSLSNSGGSSLRRSSVERGRAVFVKPVAPAAGGTVTGFHLEPSSRTGTNNAGFRDRGSDATTPGASVVDAGGLSAGLSALQIELEDARSSIVSPTKTKPPLPTSARRSLDASGSPTKSSRVGSGLLTGTPPLEALNDVEAAILRDAQARHAAFGLPGVVSAFRVAARAHRGDVDDVDGSEAPFLKRCVECASIIAHLGMDSSAVAAALLCNVLDRTPVIAEELAVALTGRPAVIDMVKGASRLALVSRMRRASARELDAEERMQLRAMLIAATDARVVIVKLADRLATLTSLTAAADGGGVDALGDERDRATRLADETLDVFVPLASRLGIWTLKARLEDACFALLHPAEHAALSLELRDGEQREAITRAVGDVSAALRAAGVDDASDVCGRPKSLYSAFRKMRAKGLGSIHDVHDVRALRIIIDGGEASCYAALAAVHAREGWTAVEGKTKDYVASPKKNGYRSLHTVVRDASGRAFEIQIRTREMHDAAEYGLAAHWRYKEPEHAAGGLEDGTRLNAGGGGASSTLRAVDEQIAWARFMLSWQGQLADDKCRVDSHSPSSGGGDSHSGIPAMVPSACPCAFPAHASTCENDEGVVAFGSSRGRGGALVSADSALCGSCDDSHSHSSPADRSHSSRADREYESSGVDAEPATPAPIFVVAVVDGAMRVLEVPRGAALSDAVLALGVDDGRLSEFQTVSSVSVNRETVPRGAEPAIELHMGDLLEISHDAIAGGESPEGSPGTSAGSVLAIEAQRRRLMSAVGESIDVVAPPGLGHGVVPVSSGVKRAPVKTSAAN